MICQTFCCNLRFNLYHLQDFLSLISLFVIFFQSPPFCCLYRVFNLTTIYYLCYCYYKYEKPDQCKKLNHQNVHKKLNNIYSLKIINFHVKRVLKAFNQLIIIMSIYNFLLNTYTIFWYQIFFEVSDQNNILILLNKS